MQFDRAGLAVCFVSALSARLLLPSLHRTRMAAELRGDWWGRFERLLRDYERNWQMTAHQRRR